jgi:glycosyltransferase involved in cell wall biosynthesis
MTAGARKPKLLYLVTEDWYFWSHRLPIARAARDAGFEVAVATRVRGHGPRIRNEGFRLLPIGLRRSSQNPLREAAAIIEIIRLYRRERPDLVHHVALKPTLYGAFAAALAGIPAVINALTGMGFVFISTSRKARFLRPLVQTCLGLLLNRPGSRLILQNPDDRRMLVDAGVIAPHRVVPIQGSGVDTATFAPAPEAAGTPIAALVSRMLWDKGVGETVQAARLLKERGAGVRVALVGDPDPDNPASIPLDQLREWQAEGAVVWRGHTEDVAAVLRDTHIAVLPSYREGLPKSLLEAAAAGRPIIASDVPGCREITRHGENGLLVPVKDARALADAIERLANDAELRQRMGRRGRELVEEAFSEAAVVERTLALYREMRARLKA